MRPDSSATYTYDLNGNRTMAGYQSGVANRLTNDGTFTYTYDDEGNLTQKSKGASLETWYYTWNNRNHLTNIRKTSNGTTDLLLVTYTYDPEGKRIKEQQWVSGVGSTETRWAYDGAHIWADLDSGNAVTVRRLFGDRTDQVLTRTVASGANVGLWVYLTEKLGSIRDLVNASAQVKAHLDYDGFGVRTDPQSSVSDRYGYTGREWQKDAGVQYNVERWYEAPTGRWLREDPLGFQAGDSNLYRYVRNHATNATDANGLQATAIGTSPLYNRVQPGLLPGGMLPAFPGGMVPRTPWASYVNYREPLIGDYGGLIWPVRWQIWWNVPGTGLSLNSTALSGAVIQRIKRTVEVWEKGPDGVVRQVEKTVTPSIEFWEAWAYGNMVDVPNGNVPYHGFHDGNRFERGGVDHYILKAEKPGTKGKIRIEGSFIFVEYSDPRKQLETDGFRILGFGVPPAGTAYYHAMQPNWVPTGWNEKAIARHDVEVEWDDIGPNKFRTRIRRTPADLLPR